MVVVSREADQFILSNLPVHARKSWARVILGEEDRPLYAVGARASYCCACTLPCGQCDSCVASSSAPFRTRGVGESLPASLLLAPLGAPLPLAMPPLGGVELPRKIVGI